MQHHSRSVKAYRVEALPPRGVQAVYSIPQRKEKAVAEGKAAAKEFDKLEQAFHKMKVSGEAFLDSAMIEGSRPPETPLEERRFPRKEGELQDDGELSRKKAMEFLTGVQARAVPAPAGGLGCAVNPRNTRFNRRCS